MEPRSIAWRAWMRGSLFAAFTALAAPGAPAAAGDERFDAEVRPVLARYCFECHGPEKQKAGLRFDAIDPDMVAGPDAHVWPVMLDVLGAGDMPPRRAEQPTPEERRLLTAWIRAELEAAAREKEVERGPVLRRLNKAQYTYALQELLGLRVDFGRALPDDAKSALGFTNDGEVLRASPLHLEYYQRIAREALDKAIAVGERPAPTRYRVTFGAGVGVGHPGATTGGYQAVPLDPEHFRVELLDAQGRPKVGADAQEQAALDAVKRKVTVGLRGSSQDRFHVVPEGLILYSALPHKEVAPGAWQGPSPNVKLEMQRVFPEEGDFVMRVEASRGYLVTGRKELLVALEEPAPRASIAMGERGGPPSAAQLRAMEPTALGPWHVAGPIRAASGDAARDARYTPLAGIDFEARLADGETRWRLAGETDGAVQTYAEEIGAVLLARAIDAPSARTMELSLGSDDALFVWLNGEEVLHADVRRGVAPDQERLELALREGRNELLMKVVNHGGGFGSYFRVVHDGTSAGLAPYEVATEPGARVLRAARADQRRNLRFQEGGLVAEDFPADSRARFVFDCAPGYYQFDLVHPALPADAMGSVRLSIGELRLDLRPKPTPEELSAGFRVTSIGAGYLNGGARELVLGGPFFVGFSHLVMTPLAPEHPLVRRLESQAESEVLADAPALRAYIGTRTDDGMDYASFDAPREVDAPLGAPRVYEFRGRLEDLPIPMPESGDDEILSGICVLGLWNDHLVRSSREPGPPLLVRSIEFEAPWHPVWPPEAHTRIFPSSSRADEERYTRELLAAFLPRAFRRPVPAAELERYLSFWRAVRAEHALYEHGVREVLVAALCSPSFLYLVEPEDARDEAGRISETALASRLAFFLWSSPPDEALLALADAGRLRAELHGEVERLLDDPRSERFLRAFAREWLRLDRLEQASINPNRFPDFTRFVKRDMAEETLRFLEHVLREGLPLTTLIDADFALVNQNLAEFYGLEGVRGVDFRVVPVARDSGRGGLLAQGAFLAGHSDGNEPHPVKRAVWVKEKLLGQPPPAPPPNVPALDPAAPGAESLTLKEQIERHRDDPSCFDCHASFDPFGIALESYDAVGRRQLERKGRPVDARTVLPDGTEVEGAEGLKRWLLGDAYELFAASVVEHLFAYALGRTPGFSDEGELEALRAEVRARGDTLRAVIHAVVASPSFRDR